MVVTRTGMGALALVVVVAGLLVACGAPTPSPAGSILPTTPPAPTTASPEPSASSAVASPTPSPTALSTPAPSATGEAHARLDGVLVAADRAARQPLAIMIDDNVVARPQAGFNAASIVYQAPADGGEDRYMFVFQEHDAKTVGPVRSGRPYFVRWAAEFRSAFGHYGGDAKTLAYLPTIDGRLIYDVDALSGSAGAFHRVKDRKKPHNAYTSTKAFRRAAERQGAPAAMPASVPGWTFVDDAHATDRPTSATIKVPYHRGATGYRYDPESNAYTRSVAGRAQIDAGDGKPVTARNVIVLWMPLSIDPQSEPGYRRPVLGQIGKGKAWVFREGRIFKGTWRKRDAGDLTRVYDAAGKEIPLVRGRTFVQVVPDGTKVTYTSTP